MKKYFIAITFLLLICFIFVNGLNDKSSIKNSKTTGSNQTNNTKKDDVVLKIESEADFRYECNSIEDLCKHSDAIVEAYVTEKDAFCDESGTVYTKYIVRVTNSYTDGIAPKDDIQIVDFGGVIDAKEYFKYQNDPKALELVKDYNNLEGKLVEYNFEGAWSPEIGEKYIWYLEKNSYNNYYCPVNCYQGIFDIEGKDAERYESRDEQKAYINTIEKKEMIESINEGR